MSQIWPKVIASHKNRYNHDYHTNGKKKIFSVVEQIKHWNGGGQEPKKPRRLEKGREGTETNCSHMKRTFEKLSLGL